MDFKITTHYDPKKSLMNVNSERYFINGRRVKPEYFEYQRTLCVIENKSYNSSYATLRYNKKKGTCLYIQTFSYN